MIQFTRHLITCGLVIQEEHATETETLTLHSEQGAFTIGTEYYSLVICPHRLDKTAPWRIEGLRGDDETEIWFTGTMQACIDEFERITQEIRVRGHQINEPDSYDFATEIREYHQHTLALERWVENRQ